MPVHKLLSSVFVHLSISALWLLDETVVSVRSPNAMFLGSAGGIPYCKFQSVCSCSMDKFDQGIFPVPLLLLWQRPEQNISHHFYQTNAPMKTLTCVGNVMTMCLWSKNIHIGP